MFSHGIKNPQESSVELGEKGVQGEKLNILMIPINNLSRQPPSLFEAPSVRWVGGLHCHRLALQGELPTINQQINSQQLAATSRYQASIPYMQFSGGTAGDARVFLAYLWKQD